MMALHSYILFLLGLSYMSVAWVELKRDLERSHVSNWMRMHVGSLLTTGLLYLTLGFVTPH